MGTYLDITHRLPVRVDSQESEESNRREAEPSRVVRLQDHLPSRTQVSASATNRLGVEDGRVHVIIQRGDDCDRLSISADDAEELLRQLTVFARVARRRSMGLVELRPFTRDDAPDPAKAPELATVVERRGYFVLLRHESDHAEVWYETRDGAPVHRDRRRGYWRICQRDCDHLRTEAPCVPNEREGA